MIINQVKQKLHLVGYLLTRYPNITSASKVRASAMLAFGILGNCVAEIRVIELA